MYLQLAENGLSDRFKPQSIRNVPKSVRYGQHRGYGSSSSGSGSGYSYGSGTSPAGFYSGSSVAPGGFSGTASFSPTAFGEPENPFIYVPDPTGTTGGMYVREDHFDNLNPGQWRQMMANLAPYQPTVQNGVLSEGMFLNDRAARKAKREDKKEKKQQQKEEKKESKITARDSKSAARVTKAEGKKIKAESGERPGKDILAKLIDTAGAFMPGKKEEAEATPEAGPRKSGDKKPFYKNPYVIGGGILVLAGTIYAVTRK